jgi:hypothetical protein
MKNTFGARFIIFSFLVFGLLISERESFSGEILLRPGHSLLRVQYQNTTKGFSTLTLNPMTRRQNVYRVKDEIPGVKGPVWIEACVSWLGKEAPVKIERYRALSPVEPWIVYDESIDSCTNQSICNGFGKKLKSPAHFSTLKFFQIPMSDRPKCLK